MTLEAVTPVLSGFYLLCLLLLPHYFCFLMIALQHFVLDLSGRNECCIMFW